MMSIRLILVLNSIALAGCISVIVLLGVLLFKAKKKLAEHNIKLFGKKKQK